MTRRAELRHSSFRTISRAAAACVIATVFPLMALVGRLAQAQTYSVIHTFSGFSDGAYPSPGLRIDSAGNLYGTTWVGGGNHGQGSGTVFKLTPSGSGWRFDVLYSFDYPDDLSFPNNNVIFAPDGTLYGTTFWGGDFYDCYYGCGTVFDLKPSPKAPTLRSRWDETIFYEFPGIPNGCGPHGDLAFDQSQNIYGTADCGPQDCGVIYELSGRNQMIIYTPKYCYDGGNPEGGVVFDQSGNLFGVYNQGGPYHCVSAWGYSCGAVYELSPSGSGWTEQVVRYFTGGSDGGNPIGGLIIDSSGNLYGTTTNPGTVFELRPFPQGWIFETLHSFASGAPMAKLVLDAAGNLYGATASGGLYGYGNVFRLTLSDSGWTYTSLHDFCAEGYPCSEGANACSNIVLAADGNLYGTAAGGGSTQCHGTNPCGESPGCGVVFKITP